ncbi:MAG: lytic transglycosylase domain-containing protein [Syntrophaceae bacterium]|nr:lytic transglycosylase domain-containing protein [Syntrophaceae bacterium]
MREQDGKILEQLLEAAARTVRETAPRSLPDEASRSVAEAASTTVRSGGGRKGSMAESAELKEIIDKAADRYGVDPSLVRCVIRAESGFHPRSTSPKGAMGLMQLMPATARDLGVKDAYNPEENVHAGTRYLKSLLDRYDGDVSRALAAYNWGMGNVDRRPDRLPEETRRYVSGIMREYQRSSA